MSEDKRTPRILMVVASRNFRDEEYLRPRQVFDGAGAAVVVASSASGRVRGSLGTWVGVDRQIAEVRARDFDAVVFVGGSGASEYFEDRTAMRLCRDVAREGRILAAICIAPSVLANAGVLSGRRATSFPSESANLTARGAVFTGEHVVVDGGVVTADGPASAAKFGERILEVLARSIQ